MNSPNVKRVSRKASAAGRILHRRGTRVSPVPADINAAEAELRNVFRADINTDVIFRRLNIAGKTSALIVYMNGMASDETIADFIMRPLMTAKAGCGYKQRRHNQ